MAVAVAFSVSGTDAVIVVVGKVGHFIFIFIFIFVVGLHSLLKRSKSLGGSGGICTVQVFGVVGDERSWTLHWKSTMQQTVSNS